MNLTTTQPTGINLVESVLSGKKSIASIEISLKISDTLTKPVVYKVFENNSDLGFTFISALIKRFMDSFGFSTKINEVQLEILTIDTLEKFSHDTIEDLILFFKMARSGTFGTTNRGVDSNLIFGEWFPKYMEQKSIAREAKVAKDKIEQTVERRGASKEEVLKYQREITEKNKSKEILRQANEYADKITKGITRERLEEIIEEWSNHEVRKNYIDILKRKRREIK